MVLLLKLGFTFHYVLCSGWLCLVEAAECLRLITSIQGGRHECICNLNNFGHEIGFTVGM